MTATKHPKLNRGSVVHGSLVLLLLVALVVVTQLMESISVTNLIESSIYMHSTTTSMMNDVDFEQHLKQTQQSVSSITMDDLLQRRSTIHTSVEYDNDDDNNDDEEEEEKEDETEKYTDVTDSNATYDETYVTTAMTEFTNQVNEVQGAAETMMQKESITTTKTTNLHTVTTQISATNMSAQKHNRTLVIVLGNVRGGPPAWKSMIREVLDPNMADLALLIGEGHPSNPPERTLLHDRAKFIWTVPEFDDWADAMEDIPDKPTDWRERVFGMTDASRRGNILLGAAQNISGSGALVFMFRFYLSQKLVEYNLLSIYDRFVVTRSDHYYLCVHDLSELSNEYLWVPQGSDHYGICDRHFIANNETILPALDILPPLVRDPEAYKVQLNTYPYNTERFLLLRWEQEGLGPLIQRFNRTLFLVSSSKDQTRWKPKGRYIKRLDVYLKYSQEYRLSSKACRARNLQKMQQMRARKRQPPKSKSPQ